MTISSDIVRPLLTYPASPEQRRIYTAHHLDPDPAAHNRVLAVELGPDVDPAAMRAALVAAVNRHESLRTHFVVHGDRLDAVVTDDPAVSFAVEPSTGQPAPGDAGAYPFDLHGGPLLRAVLTGRRLFLVAHRVAADDESLRVLAAELTGPPPAVVGRYSDRAAAGSPRPGADFLGRSLAGSPGIERRDLPAEGVARAAAAAGVDERTALLTAYVLLLSRYTDGDTVTVCLPRDLRTVAHTTGPLTGAVAIRADVSGRPSFAELATRLAVVFNPHPADASALCLDTPDALSPAGPGRFPAGRPDEPGDGDDEGDRPPLFRPGGGSSTPEHSLTVDVTGDSITVRHRLGVAGARFADHLIDMFAAEAAQPARPAPPTTPPTPTEMPLTRFESHAARHPTAIAVTDGADRISYGELDARANRLARHLRGHGVRRDTLVGLHARRGADLIVAVLAIGKAGGAYVPLDPFYPAARLSFIADDAALSVVVTDGVSGEPPVAGAMIFDLRRDADLIAAHPATALGTPPGPDDLAYVIHTSGSTGTPKGTLVTHGNVARLFSATDPWFGFDATDVWTLFHSYAFDFSVWEIWGALAYGGRLVVTPPQVSRSPAEFRALLACEGVTVLNQTPSAFRLLVAADRDQSEPLSTLRYVIFGGEALEPRSLAPWVRRYGLAAPQLINMYGITETTVHVTYHRVTSDDVAGAAGSVIGVPISDLRVTLRDGRGRPVPDGVDGEVYVAGPGVARGYLGRPELDAERFPTIDGERVYRSGDLARVGIGGELEYRGRIDDQVKVRGFRIEPGEVEAALLTHPAVTAALVLAEPDGNGGAVLAAWVATPAAVSGAVGAAELRAHLTARLPAHMVPASLVPVPEFPLTAHGKVDRARLTERRAAAGAADATPADDSASGVLRRAWADVLGHPAVGLDDNYFELGGDSIRTIQVLGRVHDAGWTFRLADLMRHQTVRELAAHTVPRTVVGAGYTPLSLLGPADRRLLPAGVEDAYPLSRLQAGMLYHSGLNAAERLYHNVSTYHMRGPYSRDAWRWTIAALLARHPILRTEFDLATFGEPMQLVRSGLDSVPIDFGDLRGLAPADRDAALRRAFDEEKDRELKWDTAPLVRFRVLRRTDEEFQLIVTEHHAILDGWSERSMLTEIVELYLFRLGRREQPPSEPPVARFGAYIAAERSAAADESSRRFWSDHLDGSTPAVLPGRPAPAGPADMRISEVVMPPEVSAGAAALARRLNVPLRIVALAAHLRVMGLLSGSTDVTTGVVHHGRTEERDGDRVLGMFLNTVPMRVRLDGLSWAGLVGRVAEIDLAIHPHRRVPMPDIRDALGGGSLYETYVNFTHFHVYESVLSQAAQLEVLDEDGITTTSIPFGAEFSVDVASARLHLGLRFDARQLTATEAAEIGGYYVRVLDAMRRQPDGPSTGVELLSDTDRDRLAAWNDTAHPVDGALTLAGLLAAQAAETPGAVAVVGDGLTLTYADLDRRVAERAELLAAAGAGPGRIVAVALPRSVDLVVALLAVIRTGAAYLPLDPDYPPERVATILTEADPVAVVGADTAAPAANGADTAAPAANGADTAAPAANGAGTGPGPDDPAYVIYTSGSTGRPKGVVISHRAIVNRLLWMQDRFRIGADDRVLQKTPATFDVSVWEFFWPLITGATLVVARPDGHRDPAYLAELIRTERITTVHFVPSMLRAFLAEPAAAACTGLRRVVVSGEALLGDLQNDFLAMLPAALYNLYGPTEAAVDVTAWECDPDPDRAPVPIGRPIWNTRVHVLDAFGARVPVGVTGEIYLGGVQVAAGYLNNPELTAERFPADPYAPGERLYRTGDLGRWRADGVVEYLGRVDQQVKLRGFRIELGEIESVLSKHPAVAAAAVLVRDQSLVAYVVGEAGEPAAVNDHLADWRSVYDALYEHAAGAPVGTDFSGWTSSYTGEPIALADMREWRDQTVARIRALRPRRILEVGVGTGLLLAELAPDADEYWGTDLSPTVVAALAETTAGHDWAARVTLRAQPAHVTDGLPAGHFDTIVLNSVVQYFPDRAYLTAVLDRLAGLLAPGGSVFLGDVRELRTLTDFHRGVEQARTGASGDRLATAVEQRGRLEKELVVAPELFAALPGWSGVDVEVKDGTADNELSRFRYDVVLHTAPGLPSLADLPVVPWTNLATITGPVRVTGVPNARLTAAADAPTAADLAALADRLAPLRVLVTWSGAGHPGELDIVVTEAAGPLTDVYRPSGPAPAALSNDPVTARRDALLAGTVRDHLRAYLPEYMVPSIILPLPALPLTGSGKIDRRALAERYAVAAAPKRAYRAPGTATERLLCALVGDVLGFDRVGLDDSFFDLGGHSLLAFRLIARIQAATGTRIDVNLLFEAPTPAGMAALLGGANPARRRTPMLALRRGGTGAPLFCVHPAAGTGSVYAALLPGLDPARPVWALQSTGTAYPSLRAMAADYLDRIRGAAPTGPVHLLGWSFGGIMAHELAIRLRSAGVNVASLTVVDAYPAEPGAERLDPGHAMAALLVSLGLDLRDAGPVLTADQAVAIAAAQGSPLGTLGPDRFAEMAGTFAANVILQKGHRPGCFDGDLLLIESDPALRRPDETPAAWAPHIDGRIEVRRIDVPHGALLNPAPAATITAALEHR